MSRIILSKAEAEVIAAAVNGGEGYRGKYGKPRRGPGAFHVVKQGTCPKEIIEWMGKLNYVEFTGLVTLDPFSEGDNPILSHVIMETFEKVTGAGA